MTAIATAAATLAALAILVDALWHWLQPAGFKPLGMPAASNVQATYTPISEQVLSHGRFENFTVYAPHGTPRQLVLALSGLAGWTPALGVEARRLAAQGFMVAGLDTTRFNQALQADGGQCVYPDGDLENLSHFIQAFFKLPSYVSPILLGDAAGGTLAYATLAQAPSGTFTGAVSRSFCPAYPLRKPLCEGSGIKSTPRAASMGGEGAGNTGDPGVEFSPAPSAGAWIAIESAGGAAVAPAAQSAAPTCEADRDTIKKFVAAIPGAQLVPASTSLDAALDEIMAQHPVSSAAEEPSALRDLPLVSLPASPNTPASEFFAIILSGDGGWAGLDKEVAGALAATGIPVVGLDSLRYFWSARTPDGLAHDLDRMVAYYSSALGKSRVLLIGYSQGADVLPFAVNRLSAATRSRVALTAILGMSEHALFEFHVTSWISDDNSGPATLPEVEKIAGVPVLCVYGEGETDSLCPQLDPRRITVVKLKGGHHFDGDYAGLARAILAAAPAH